MSDPAELSLTDLASAIRRRKVSSAEVTKALLARIKTWQPKINAFARVEAEDAMKAARAADRALANGKIRGPLHGVPLAHKDMYYVKGKLAECGSKIRKGWTAPATATATALTRLEAAGDMRRIPRIAHMAGVDVVAGRSERKLHHVERAEPQRAGPFEPSQCRGGRGRDPPFADLGAAFRKLALDVIHVLVGERYAMQRAFDLAVRKRAVGGARGLHRVLGLDTCEGVELGLPFLDAREQRLGDFGG